MIHEVNFDELSYLVYLEFECLERSGLRCSKWISYHRIATESQTCYGAHYHTDMRPTKFRPKTSIELGHFFLPLSFERTVFGLSNSSAFDTLRTNTDPRLLYLEILQLRRGIEVPGCVELLACQQTSLIRFCQTRKECCSTASAHEHEIKGLTSPFIMVSLSMDARVKREVVQRLL